MTDLLDDLDGPLEPPPARLGHPCPVDGCDYEAASPMALGLHKRRAHGIAGSGRRAKPARKTPPRSRKAPAEPAGNIAASEIRDHLRAIADHLAPKAPRTAESLSKHSPRLAAATTALWQTSDLGSRVLGNLDDADGRAQSIALAVAAAPVALVAFSELALPRLAARLRKERIVTAEDGTRLRLDRNGDLWTVDTGEHVGNINDPPPAPAGPDPAGPTAWLAHTEEAVATVEHGD